MTTKELAGKALLEWFLDFLNLDLDRISVGALAKWAVEISGLFGGSFHPGQPIAGRPSVRPGIVDRIGWEVIDRIDLELCHRELADFFGSMMMRVESTLANIVGGEWVPEKQVDFIPSFSRLDIPNLSADLAGTGASWDMKTEDVANGETKRLYRCRSETVADMAITLSFRTPTSADALKFYFCLALNGVPVGAFRQCEECGKWLIHLTKRGRQFCSNPCAARAGIRRRRAELKESDPAESDATLKEKAECAHKNCAKKVKAKLKAAKPQRRPYKHKEE
jgi:hypothetical protein